MYHRLTLTKIRMILKFVIFFFEMTLYMHLTVQTKVLYVIPSPNPGYCNTTSCVTLSQVAKRIDLQGHSESVQLIFLPGDHNLKSDLDISSIEGLSMISNSSFQLNITCQSNASFHFNKIAQISIKGLTFLGCGNLIASTYILEIENSLFFGRDASGTAIELIDTNARIKNCSFAFNSNGNFKGPIQILNFWKFKYVSLSTYSYVGGAVIANHSSILIVRSSFEGNSAEIGGAIFTTSGSNITVFNSSFIKNSATYKVNGCNTRFCQFGGALHTESGVAFRTSVGIFQSEFSKNTAKYGGAISTFNCTLSIGSSTFYENAAIKKGGVIEASVESEVCINDCKFWSNIVWNYGAVIGLYLNSTMTINMSLFYRNSAKYFAGVLYIEGGSGVTISMSQFYKNYAYKSGGAMIVRSFSSAIIHKTEFCDNYATDNGGAIVLMFADLILNKCILCNCSSRNRGGAIDANEKSGLKVYKCEFRNNFAVDLGGGAINAEYTTSVIIDESTFIQNTLSEGIGGALLVSSTTLTINNCSFLQNGVRSAGGAIAATQSQVYFRSACNLEQNIAYYGGAIYAIDSTLYVYKNMTLMLNTAFVLGGGALLQYSKLICQNHGIIAVVNNSAATKGGGIYATNSRITVHFNRGSDSIRGSTVYFTNNSAKLGGGIYLEFASELFIEKIGLFHEQNEGKILCNFCFFSNHANLGGAIYVADETNYETCSSTSRWGHYCFLQSLSPYPSSCVAETDECNYASVRFEQNTAFDSGGPVLYGGLLDRCIIRAGSEFESQKQNKSTGQVEVILMNGLTSFKHLSKIGNLSNSEVNTVINSSPVRVCLCTPEGRPDCSYKAPLIRVKKGFNFNVSLVAVDQVNHTLGAVSIYSSLRYAQSGLGDSQLIQMTNNHCTNLTFSIHSPLNSETLTLYADGPCRNASNSSLSLDIMFSTCTCPIGFQSKVSEITNCVCECDSNLPKFITNCNSYNHTLLRKSNFWIRSTAVKSNLHDYLFYPYCPFDYCLRPDTNIYINLNNANGADIQCANNRSGTLCGSCKPGLSLSLGSSRCIQCSKTWRRDLAAVLAAYLLSGVIVIAVILVLNLTVATGTLNGILFYANIIDSNSNMYFSSSLTKFLFVFISWLNLEIGFDVCFINSMTAYQKTWLQMVFPVYVILLVFAIITLSKHSIRFSMLISKKNPVATLATLVLLSYSKMLRVIIFALSMAKLKLSSGSKSVESVWLPDATIKYLHGKHIFLFIVAIMILILGAAYTFLLLFWQWLLKWVKYQKLCHFLEPYHAPYILKYRYWTGLLLLVRIAIYIAMVLNGSGDPSMNLLVIIIATSGLLFLKGQIGQIYKSKVTDVIETVCYLNVLLLSAVKLFMLEARRNDIVPSLISGLITLLLFLYVLVYHVFTEFCLKQCKKLRQNRLKTIDKDINNSIIHPPVQEDKVTPTFSIINAPTLLQSSTTEPPNET